MGPFNLIETTSKYGSKLLIYLTKQHILVRIIDIFGQTYQEDPEVDYGHPYSGPQLPVRRSCTGGCAAELCERNLL